MKVQRIRVTFARGESAKYITHLDVMRFWERALRRAELPVAYSEGFSPHAQLALAAPLAVGTTSDAELMDVFMAEVTAPKTLIQRLVPQLPQGISIVSAEEAGMALPALQADVRFAEYDVDAPAPDASVDVAAAIARFLAAETIPWEHRREDEVKSYDIRAQVETIALVDADEVRDGGRIRLRMRLKNDSSGSGRPEQVLAALGLPAPARIHRTRLLLAGPRAAREPRYAS